MLEFVRPNVRAMKGYVPGEQPRQGGVIKLNTNESPYPPSPKVFEAIREALLAVRGHEGAEGTYYFDKNGDGLHGYNVVRNDKGLAAFVNVCRHRRHLVMKGRGNATLMQCGYHAWTYDLAGGLRRAPRGWWPRPREPPLPNPRGAPR